MAPQLPFDEIGIVLTTMTAGVQAIYFAGVILLNLLGLYLADKEIDKRSESEKGYDLEWKELAPYAFASAVMTMASFELAEVPFWQSMMFAILMGAIFRALLPELIKAMTFKTKAIMQVMFGNYNYKND